MKNYKYILAIDPSGNFKEGKGTTGMCLLDTEKNCIIQTWEISARNFETWLGYCRKHTTLIYMIVHNYKDVVVVIEDYLLYGNKALSQTNSRMETPKLIGILEYFCFTMRLECVLQTAAEVKQRWNDEVLLYKKYLSEEDKVSRHVKDSIRHAVHYHTFYNEKEET